MAKPMHLKYQSSINPHGELRTAFYNPHEIKRRRRTSRSQFKTLEKAFCENPKPNASTRRHLAQRLSMTPRGIQVWFQNRRAKSKQADSVSSAKCDIDSILYSSGPSGKGELVSNYCNNSAQMPQSEVGDDRRDGSESIFLQQRNTTVDHISSSSLAFIERPPYISATPCHGPHFTNASGHDIIPAAWNQYQDWQRTLSAGSVVSTITADPGPYSHKSLHLSTEHNAMASFDRPEPLVQSDTFPLLLKSELAKITSHDKAMPSKYKMNCRTLAEAKPNDHITPDDFLYRLNFTNPRWLPIVMHPAYSHSKLGRLQQQQMPGDGGEAAAADLAIGLLQSAYQQH
ncbi:hypothetical protein BGX28_008959 [Mortierella sp. GBA30]|nr:hypothetical protein BGX28_008959 [Mortierella sp. GBA30]